MKERQQCRHTPRRGELREKNDKEFFFAQCGSELTLEHVNNYTQNCEAGLSSV